MILDIYFFHNDQYKHVTREKDSGDVIPFPLPWGPGSVDWTVPGEPGEYYVTKADERGVQVLALIFAKDESSD